MLQGLFISRGLSAKTHDESLTHLGQDFIMQGTVDKRFGRFFTRLPEFIVLYTIFETDLSKAMLQLATVDSKVVAEFFE